MKKLFYIFIPLLFISCSISKPLNKPITDTSTVKVVYQTVYQDRVDSVYIDKYHYIELKGDTVFKTDSVIQYKFKYLNNTDTLIKTDTITLTKEVEKPVIIKQKDFTPAWIFIGVILAVGIFVYIKKRFRHE